MIKSQPTHIKTNDVVLQDLMSLKYIYGYGRGSDSPKEFLFDLTGDSKSTSKFVIYVAGNNLVLANLETKDETIISGTEGATRISSMTVNDDKSTIAVAEDIGNNSIVTIFDYKNEKLRRKKTLVCKEFDIQTYEALVFGKGEHSKLLFAVAKTPTHKLLAWEYDKSRMKTKTDFSGFSKVSGQFFSVVDDNFLFVFGHTSNGFPIKCFWLRADHEQLSLVPKNDLIKDFLKSYNKNFVCFCVMSDASVIFGNEKGELILFNRQYELKCLIPNSPIGMKIMTMTSFGRGFFIGGGRHQTMLFEKIEKDLKSVWQRTDSVYFSPVTEEGESVTSITVFDESNLLFGFSNGELRQVNLMSNKRFKSEPAMNSFHYGDVLDVDICDRKPFLASIGTDKTLKVWNYIENSLEFLKKFEKEIFAVSFHCSGLYLALAFKEKVKVVCLMINEIRMCYDVLIRDVKMIKFSNGGHLLATVSDNSCQLWDFFTGEFKNNLVIKDNESPIVWIQWAVDDLRLFLGTLDGKISEVLIKDKPEIKPYGKTVGPLKGFKLWNEYKINSNSTWLVSASTEKSLTVQMFMSDEDGGSKKPSEKNQSNQFQETSFPISSNSNHVISVEDKSLRMRTFKLDENLNDTVLANSGKYLFCPSGESKGVLKVLSFPDMSVSAELNLSPTGFKKTLMSNDDTTLFLVGFDNNVYVVDLRDKEYKARKNKEGLTGYIDEFLVDEVKMKKTVEEIDVLTRRVTENEKINEMKILKENRIKEEEIEKINQKMLLIVEERREKIKELNNEIENRVAIEKKLCEDLDVRHSELKTKMDVQHKAKIEKERIKHEETKATFNLMLETSKQTVEELKLLHSKKMEEIQEIYQKKLDDIDSQLEKLEKENRFTDEEFEKQIETIENELDDRIQQKKEFHEKDLEEALADKNYRESEVNASKLDLCSKETKKKEEEKKQKDINDEIKNITEEIQVKAKESENNEKEILEREKTILQKLERINELVRKKQELDKFKFVLHYKIEELKKEKGPREIEIAKMKQQLKNMQQEIHQFSKNYSVLKLSVSELRLKLQGQSKTFKSSQWEISEKSNILSSFRGLLSEATTVHINDYKELKKRLLFLYNTYVVNETHLKEETVDKQKVFSEQRAYLENCLRALRDKFTKNMALHKTDHKRAMKENVDLIGAINELKREKKLKLDNVNRIKNLKKETKKEIEIAMEIKNNKEKITTLKETVSLKKNDTKLKTIRDQ